MALQGQMTSRSIGEGAKMLVFDGDRMWEMKLRYGEFKIDTDYSDIYSEISMNPIRVVSQQSVTFEALLVIDEDGAWTRVTESAKPQLHNEVSGVYTTVVDLTVKSIREAAELVGASEDDVFDIEETDDGYYKLVWIGR